MTLLFLGSMMALVKYLQPYNKYCLNQLEFLSLLTSTASVYFCIYFISNKVDSSQIKYGKETANLLMFLLIIALQSSFFLYWAYQFIQEFKVTLILQYPRIYQFFSKNSLSQEVEQYKARVMAPFIEQLKHTVDKIAQDINIYERGMVPLYDRDLRENMQKISQFHTKIDALKKFHSSRALCAEVDDVIRNLNEVKVDSRLKAMESAQSPKNGVRDSDTMFGEDTIMSSVVKSQSINSPKKSCKKMPPTKGFAFKLTPLNQSSVKINPEPPSHKGIQANDDDVLMILQSTTRRQKMKKYHNAWGSFKMEEQDSNASTVVRNKRIRQQPVREIAAGVDHEVITRLEKPIAQIQPLVIQLTEKTDDENQRVEGSTHFPHFDI
ncbi:hypothetical protein FGO68_gene8356 [Halteria grandinella]|uniref:Uncharacterized protein n=1 Tax=Halteria grandinella TaxID=5974 RepID=A0A8J8NGA0_HALGN|nr:hypothetical protein FGO68_gene8356 [Halteria grandinella]